MVVGLVLVGAASLVIPAPAQAAAGINKTINYQGRLLNAAGAVVADGTYNMEFQIWQGGTGCVTGCTSANAAANNGGTLIWTEDWVNGTASPDNRVVVKNGYFSVNLGSICLFTSTTCTASTGNGQTNTVVDFNQDTLWMSMNIGNTSAASTFSLASGDGYMIPFKRLASAVYSLQADNASKLGGLTSSQFLQTVPANSSVNVVAPTASGVVGLTVRASTTSAGDILDVQDSSSVKQAFFDSTGALNVAKTIQPTVTNTVDLGLVGTTFKTGYFGTSVVAPAVTTALINASSTTLDIGISGGTTTITIGKVSQAVVMPGNLSMNGVTTSANFKLGLSGSVTSAASTLYGIFYQLDFNPTNVGPTLSAIYGNNNSINIASSALDVTTYVSMLAGLATGAGYTGTVATGTSLHVSAPVLNGANKFTVYNGVNIATNGSNGLNTSGTVTNNQLRILSTTAGAAAGGTVNNYGINMQVPTGSLATGGTTNNYGILMTDVSGAPGMQAGTWSLYNNSLSASYFSGTVQAVGGLTVGKASSTTGNLTFQNASNANTVVLQSGVTTGIGYTLTLPTALGSSGDCIKDTTGAGVLGFGTCGSASANLTLSNLTGPTAINTDLTFAAADRLLTVTTQPTVATAGNTLTVRSAAGNTTGAGGLTTVAGGTGGASGVGGGVAITGGNSGVSGGSGGNVVLSGGQNGSSGAEGSVIVKPQAGGDSAATFQVQNAGGTTGVNVNTLTTDGNLWPNPSFEQNINGAMLHVAGTTLGHSSAVPAQYGTNVLSAIIPGATNDGVEFRVAFKPSTTYAVSMWLRRDASSATNFNIGLAENGTDTNCTTTPSTITVDTTWRQYTCSFTTGTTVNNGVSNFYLKVNSAAGSTVYIDGLTLVLGTNPLTYANPGTALQVEPYYNNLTLNALNNGELQPWQLNTTALTLARSRPGVTQANGYIYVLGGGSGIDGTTPTSTVYYAKVNADGSLGAFSSTNTLNTAIAGGGATVVNGYIYLVGGATTGPTDSAVVQYARLNSDGTTGTWTTTTPLTAARDVPGVFSYNGYIYAMGGGFTGTTQATIYYAKVNGDGTITGPWTTNATSLNAARQSFTPAVSAGYVYSLGGNIASGGDGIASTESGKLNSDGSITAVTAGSAMPAIHGDTAAVALNGYVYSVTGWSGAATNLATSSVYYSPVMSNGTITGAWSTSTNPLPIGDPTVARAGRENAGAIAVNGYIYVIGGDNNFAAQTTVYYTSTARTKMAGGLDLLGGSSSQALGEGAGAGGNLTAGNTLIAGTLQVQDAAVFNRGVMMQGTSVANGDFTINGSSAQTTQAQLVVTGSIYAHSATEIGSAATIAATDATTSNGAGVASTTNALLLSTTLNVSGATGTGVKTLNALNVGAPTLTACAGTNTCAWNGLRVTGQTSALANLTQTGLNVTTGNITGGTSVGASINLGTITTSGKSTGLKIVGTATAPTAGTFEKLIDVQDSGGTNLLEVRDMSNANNSFGAAVTSGAFISRNSYWGEEYSLTHQNNCTSTTSAAAAYARGDSGNGGVAGCATAGGDLSISNVLQTAAGVNACSETQSGANLNGTERITATSVVTASNSARCLEYISGGAAGTPGKYFNATNLPVMTMKVRPSGNIATNTNAMFWVGLSDQTAANLPNTGMPSNGIFFTACTAWSATTPTCPAAGSPVWTAFVVTGGTATAITCTGATISTVAYAYLRIEVRASNDIHFFVDPDVTTGGVTETECGTGFSGTGPSVGMSYVAQTNVISNVAATINLDIDYARIWQDDAATVPNDPNNLQGDFSPIAQTNTVTTPSAYDSTLNGDITEAYSVDDPAQFVAGEVVSIDEMGGSKVRKSKTAYDNNVLGVVSASPQFVLGQAGEKTVNVSMAGRVPVKVSTENGPIHPGDLLTASSVAGVTMRATKVGATLGQALDGYDGKKVGQVLVRLNVTGHKATVDANDLQAGPVDQATIGSLMVTGDMVVSGNATFRGKLAVNDLEIGGHVTVGKDTAGTATIQVGMSSVDVKFAKPYANIPVIGTSVSDFVTVKVSNKSANGFTLSTQQPVKQDLPVDWTALEPKKVD